MRAPWARSAGTAPTRALAVPHAGASSRSRTSRESACNAADRSGRWRCTCWAIRLLTCSLNSPPARSRS
eukprot:6403321-Prymnesium_polylepis.1